MEEEGSPRPPERSASEAEPVQPSLEKHLQVLVVDDDEPTARMIKILIERAFDAEVEIALDYASALRRFDPNEFDLVTLDYQLQDGDGLELLREFKQYRDSPPVIMVTGRGDEQVAARAFLLGASGYVIKDLRLNTTLPAAVDKAVTEIALKKAEAAVKAGEARLNRFVNATLEGISMTDSELKITYANQALAEMLGLRSAEELIGRSATEFMFDEDKPEISRIRRGLIAEKEILESRLRRADGSALWVVAALMTDRDEEGGLKSLTVSFTDITERTIAEEALRLEKDRAQLYLDIAGVMLLATDSSGTITLINEKGLKILGYRKSELLGEDWFETCIPERHKDQVRSIFSSIMSGELDLAEYFENPVLTSSGEERVIAWHNAALRNRDGKIVGMLSSGEDITERLTAQEELRAAAVRAETLSRLSKALANTSLDFEATLSVIARNVVELVGDACLISLISDDGQYVEASAFEYVNPEAVDLTEILFEPVPIESVRGPIAAALSTGKSQMIPVFDFEEFSADLLQPLREEVQHFTMHSLIMVPLRVEGRTIGLISAGRAEPGNPYTEDDLLLVEEVAYFAATTIDSAHTHQRLQNELAIRRMHERELEAANAELEGFAHTVSHDLQGPIAAVNLGLNLLADELRESDTGWSPEKLDSLIGPLQSKINTCASLVESMLELAESGPVPQDVSEVEVGDIVRKCIESNSAEIEKRAIKVECDLDMGRLVANPTHVYQLFSNLIGNAVIHNKSREPRVEIRHLDDSPEGVHRYLVRDNGGGIPESYLGNLFTPFFRAEGGGTVLGLAIVDKVLKSYGGTIEAYNHGGACFEFSIKNFKGL